MKHFMQPFYLFVCIHLPRPLPATYLYAYDVLDSLDTVFRFLHNSLVCVMTENRQEESREVGSSSEMKQGSCRWSYGARDGSVVIAAALRVSETTLPPPPSPSC